MVCEYCFGVSTHDSRCPNSPMRKINHYCSICKEGIFDGEEYIENNNNKYAHWECIDGRYDLVNWLGYEIKKMESDDN